jgi:tetratricopeptide (TPR) repeat protein
MSKTRWKAFAHADRKYDYDGDRLKKSWPRLHQGDREPFPEAGGLRKLVAQCAEFAPEKSAAKASLEGAVEQLLDAWRAYHRGDFGTAIELGVALGPLGYGVANKAANIYATYLESSKDAKLALFLESSRRAEFVFTRARTVVNAWYFYAQALGRYGQGISVTKALAQGLGGKIKNALEETIRLEPRHADAHIALGAYHAEVIAKVGSTLGALTYGASKEAALKHFETALELNPHSAIARIEYANGLAMLSGKAGLERATALYEEAARCDAADAMERLDAELARDELTG